MLRPSQSTVQSQDSTTAADRASQRHSTLASSSISLFLANLRLLNLDLRNDWPDITVKTFDTRDAQQNQKRRIQCVEWALYRLFEVWDAETTRDKLQPFFPPLEPLQSLNLRAALYRCLNEVKKTGVLGREVILRKTMLDECKGERLDELLFLFSAVVVKKGFASRRGRHVPIAEDWGTSPNLPLAFSSVLRPLVLSHRAVLSGSLEHRARTKAGIDRLYTTIAESSAQLKTRKTRARNAAQAFAQQSPLATRREITQHVQQGWTGGAEGRTMLLEGRPTSASHVLATVVFEDLWEQSLERLSPPFHSEECSLLERLEARAKIQTLRLSKWQQYQAKHRSTTSHVRDMQDDTACVDATRLAPKFEEHKAMHIPGSHSENSMDNTQIPAEYNKILSDMRQSMAKVRRDRGGAKPSYLGNVCTRPIATYQEERSGGNWGQSKVPVFAHDEFAARQTLQRSTKDLPDPLVSMAKSDLVTKPDESWTKAALNSAVSESYSERLHRSMSPKLEDQVSEYALSESLLVPATGLSGLACRVDSNAEEDSDMYESETNRHSALQPHELDNEEIKDVHRRTEPVDQSALPDQEVDESEIAQSVVEMGSPVPLRSTQDPLNDALQDAEVPSSTSQPEPSKSPVSSDGNDSVSHAPSPAMDLGRIDDGAIYAQGLTSIDRRTSLADRTKQTMSQATYPAGHGFSRRPKEAHDSVSSYPLNQFETPIRVKHAPSEQNIKDSSSKRDITPVAKLFLEDAEYASIFKSRPKVSLSTILSPGIEGRRGSSEASLLNSSPLNR